MSDLGMAGVVRSGVLQRALVRTAVVASLLALTACSAGDPHIPRTGHAPDAAPTIQPVATLQELMQSEVDAAADSIWDAVETTATKSGEENKQPRTPEEWEQVRRNAIVLIEAANLLTVDKRKLSAAPFPAEAAGALDSTEIEKRIAGNRAAFNQYALTLRQTARTMLTAIDAKDPQALVSAGGVLDEVCESCHMTFWYPNQVIPPFPTKGDPRFGQITVNPTE
jgi:cytochrome c556